MSGLWLRALGVLAVALAAGYAALAAHAFPDRLAVLPETATRIDNARPASGCTSPRICAAKQVDDAMITLRQDIL